MNELINKIKNRQAKVGVIGLGYVGLPLAVEFAKVGFSVLGFDIDARKVAEINQGRSYILDVPGDVVNELAQQGKLKATSDFRLIGEQDTINICVPTPLSKNRDPDMAYIMSAVDEIAKYIRSQQLIILESTTYPGTTEELVLSKLDKENWRVGRDFYLAFSPERVDPGNEKYNTRNVPKVVGGMTPACTEIACALYSQCIEKVVPVSSPRVAEMVKLLENTFRSVNIGLVNEIALMCDKMGINVWEVIDAASTKPFGFMPFYPGPGLGGHCIPVDPFYLSWKARSVGFEARFIELAGMVNSLMPEHVVNKVSNALNWQEKCVKNSKILILGVAYKNDIDDVRESPAIDVIRLLHGKGARISYCDPYVAKLVMRDHQDQQFELKAQPLTLEALQSADCVVITTAHKSFDYKKIHESAKLIVDTRNALKGFNGSHIVKL